LQFKNSKILTLKWPVTLKSRSRSTKLGQGKRVIPEKNNNNNNKKKNTYKNNCLHNRYGEAEWTAYTEDTMVCLPVYIIVHRYLVPLSNACQTELSRIRVKAKYHHVVYRVPYMMLLYDQLILCLEFLEFKYIYILYIYILVHVA
jgi:hypothetical protein